MTACQACGKQNRDDFRFCQECGKTLAPEKAVRLCPHCAAEVELNFRFCGQCGQALALEQEVVAESQQVDSAAAMAASMDMGKTIVEARAVSAGGVTGADAVPVPQSATVIPQAAIAALGRSGAIDDSGGAGGLPDSAVAEEDAPATVSQAAVDAPAASEDGLEATDEERSATDLKPDDSKPEQIRAASSVGSREPMASAAARPFLVSVLHDGSDGESVSVSEDCFDVGRTAGHCQFGTDPYLSERHCRFEKRSDGWYVIDLDSRNGLYWRLRSPHSLADRAHILAGTHLFNFSRVRREEYELGPAMEHGVMLFGSPLRRPWGCLRVITTAGVHRDVRFLYRQELVVGRESQDWSFADDEFMSRRHFTVRLVDGKAVVVDMGSSNGTFVQLSQEHRLEDGDTVRVGNQILRFGLP